MRSRAHHRSYEATGISEFCWPRGGLVAACRASTAAGVPVVGHVYRGFLASAELTENLFIVLSERRRRRINSWTSIGEGERRDRHAETTLHSSSSCMAVNDAAGGQLWIRDGFSHRAHSCGRYVARLQELFPFVCGACQHDVR